MERGTSSCGPPVAQTMDDLPEEENTADNFNDDMLYTRAAVNIYNQHHNSNPVWRLCLNPSTIVSGSV